VDILASLWDLVAHLDVHLGELIRHYGAWVYAILFAIVFAETGLVVTPFLPGDSLLFVAGALAALGGLDVHVLVLALVAAAVLGNSTNYAIGRFLGKRLFRDRSARWLNPVYLDRTHAFYDRHGGKAVVISRFIPIVRTYVPFVAGLGAMGYGRFTLFNVAGATLWVASLCYSGYWFGNLQWVKDNLTLIIFGIIGVSLVPVALGAIQARRAPH